MDVRDCILSGLKLIRCDVRKDNRGFFAERFHAERFVQAGLPARFVQENHSRSLPGVLRGLHYQHAPPQGKLVGAISGRIWDVAVDIRPESPTFGRHHAAELSGENGVMLWIPAGFAHGLCVLGDEPADIFYMVDSYYCPGGEGGIRYDDPELNIPWPVRNPILSERDRQLPGWKEYCAAAPAWGEAA